MTRTAERRGEVLHRWEGRTRRVSWKELQRVAEVLEVNPRTVYRDLLALRASGHVVPAASINGRLA